MTGNQKPTPEQVTAFSEALKNRTAIVCYAKCWACQFGQCAEYAHTWMDPDDMAAAGITAPTTSEGWAAFAADKPCGCHCMRERS